MRETAWSGQVAPCCSTANKWLPAACCLLSQEMRERGIERNVHTFSALMNVCIKCGQYKLALDVYRDMRALVRAGVGGRPARCVRMFTAKVQGNAHQF